LQCCVFIHHIFGAEACYNQRMTRKNSPELNRKLQAARRERMGEDHKQIMMWVRHEDVDRLNQIAVQRGWLHESGRYKGQPNVQKAALELMLRGLAVEESDSGD